MPAATVGDSTVGFQAHAVAENVEPFKWYHKSFILKTPKYLLLMMNWLLESIEEFKVQALGFETNNKIKCKLSKT